MTIDTNLDKICYKKNYVDRVIFRFDFSEPVKQFSKLDKDIESEIIKLFPIPEPHKRVNTVIEIKEGTSKIQSTENDTTWVFHTKDRSRTLEIASTNVAIIMAKYDKFDEMQSLLNKIFDIISEIDKSTTASRVGLRYINIFNFDDGSAPTDFKRYFNSNLTAMIDIAEDNRTISRAFNSLCMNLEDVNILMQYGIHNQDFPAPVRKKEFILDIDAYYQGITYLTDVNTTINRFHSEIQKIFENSITNETRAFMGLINE